METVHRTGTTRKHKEADNVERAIAQVFGTENPERERRREENKRRRGHYDNVRFPNIVSKPTEPAPKSRATQTPHELPLTLPRTHKEATNAKRETRLVGEAPEAPQSHATQTMPGQHPEASSTASEAKAKTQSILPVKRLLTPAQATRERVKATGHDVERAVAIASAHVLHHGHGVKTVNPNETEDGFQSDGSFRPNGYHARAQTFVRAVLHCPALMQYHGDGCGLVERLAKELGDDGLNDVLSRLDCTGDHLELAATKSHTLLGDDLVSAAARGMANIIIPPRLMVKIRFYPNVLAVVRLVGALAELKCLQTGDTQPTVYLSGDCASRALGIPKAECLRALKRAVYHGVLELVKPGHRKHRNAKGTAAEYRLVWGIARLA